MGLGTEPLFTWYDKITLRIISNFFSLTDDTTRVSLQGNEDYINASYVNVSTESG
jgi:protein tyrosine phosphatase